ncbi:MAG: nitroreductase family protein [Promethearchaeota archaeon]
MDFEDVIRKRRSIRRFKENKVPDEIIKDILEAARLAPTWANMQGVRFIVVDEKDKLEELKAAINQRWTKTAPCFIVACIEPRKSGKNKNGLEYFTVDAAICMEHIILAATNKGLGTCWIGYFDEEQTKKILKIPKRTRVIAMTPIGYPDQEPKPQDRKSLEEIAFRNEYGNKWK